jgi:alkanesulfonate monooxygenase SsuD/methylene tetrahydromethanopterin reductase-like flavin-dependent oxidoreductase (luciferase family)
MEKGLHIQQDGLPYEEIREITIEAEKKGVNSVWVLDHFHASPKPDKQQMLECWTLLSALASETKTIRVGVLVLNINNRLPAVVAKMATTLDMISRGRLDFGVGAGGTIRAERQQNFGYENEFDAYGIDFPKNPSIRIEKLDEGLEIIKRMWTQDTATFNGKHYSIRKAICFPKPVQKPYPPIWIGSRGGPKMM